jgi:hypothetical protein
VRETEERALRGQLQHCWRHQIKPQPLSAVPNRSYLLKALEEITNQAVVAATVEEEAAAVAVVARR